MSDRAPTPEELELVNAKIRTENLTQEKLSLESEILSYELENSKREADTERNNLAQARIWPYWGNVDKGSVKTTIDALGLWVRKDPSKPISIVFNSPGGSVFDGLALFDFIREVRANGTPVHTTALGMAASMGGILLQAGEHRVMGRNAYMLIHEVSAGAVGKLSEMEDEAKLMGRLCDKLVTILAERSTFSPAQIKTRWKRKDWWLDADECLRYGFVDEVR